MVWSLAPPKKEGAFSRDFLLRDRNVLICFLRNLPRGKCDVVASLWYLCHFLMLWFALFDVKQTNVIFCIALQNIVSHELGID